METAYEGIWVLDSQFRVIQVNDRMAEMLGYSPNEIRGRKVTEFIHQEDLPDHEHHASERLKGVRDRYERRYLRKDGTWLHTLVSATPVFDNTGFAGSFAMVTDITDLKGAEKALRKSERLYRTDCRNRPGNADNL